VKWRKTYEMAEIYTDHNDSGGRSDQQYAG
jgi:hypothetical protein